MTVKTVIIGFLLVLLLYFLYVVVTAVFLFPKAEKEENRPIKHVGAYMGEKESTVDRVLLLEDGYESGLARMRMIHKPSIQSILPTMLLEKANQPNLLLEP